MEPGYSNSNSRAGGLERVAKPVNDGSQALAEYFGRPPPKEA